MGMAAPKEDLTMAKQYTENDPEYWALFAKTLGNPAPDYEDDSEFVDENGIVIADDK